MELIDLRSDTVTWPTETMRRAMAAARVDDDVYGTDPTMNELEALAARSLGKEAGLFVASGTMGNLIAVLTHCGRGDEMILGDRAHIFEHEAGGSAALGGVHAHTIPVNPDGTLPLEGIRAAIREDDFHYPRTRLVCLENSQGAMGGIPITATYTRAVRALCDDKDLKLHIDGARIWNAAAALECDVKDLAAPADSIMFCLSKGLCAPVGSMLVGSASFISAARRIRKMLGGGMRQAGVLGAAGIIAINEMTGRLKQDHETARYFATRLKAIPGIDLEMDRVKTNIFFITLGELFPVDAPTLCRKLAPYGIVMQPDGERLIRIVTHYWIHPEHVDTVIDSIEKIAGEG